VTSNDRSFQKICAWCGRVEAIDTKATEGLTPSPALPVSHTICGVCLARELVEVERVVRRKRSSA